MTHPAKIGRYHVVGRLASGGMADILLAKALGRGGFEQAVVIKRLLPHLAHQRDVAEMFLDEARIVAAIQHPNVVRIHELGWSGDEPFLAMEYLAGESLHGLMRRLASRDDHLGYATCAHIGAQLCAGLHAAHELRGPRGEPLGIVHRDVSPQNVFVTYDGAVKLLDFGVALAADRIVRTADGHIKGKHAYMSPEQVEGEALDRRSDLFAVGTVLWELVTGRRLFQRVNELKTMQAVLGRTIPSPSEMVEDCPEELEDVIMAALDRDPDRRPPDANEMRRQLVGAMQHMDVALLPDEALAVRMRSLFPERIEEKQEMLRRISAGTSLDSIPPAEVDLNVELPEGETPGPPPHLRRRRMLGILGLAALALGAASWLGQQPARPATATAKKVIAASPADAPAMNDAEASAKPEGRATPATADRDAGVGDRDRPDRK